MRLANALLCIDCEEIFEPAEHTGVACPKCGSRVFAPIAAWVATTKLPAPSKSLPWLHQALKWPDRTHTPGGGP
jgi:hypothetical protein